MWELMPSGKYIRRFREYEKKHREELLAILANLEDLRAALDSGARPALIQAGFLHREPMGVLAVDQTGSKGRKKETRLYFFAAETDCVLHLITIGDKNSQPSDIQFCKEFVSSLRRRDTT